MRYDIEVEATATIREIWRTPDRKRKPTQRQAEAMIEGAEIEFISDHAVGDEENRVVIDITPTDDTPAKPRMAYVLTEERNGRGPESEAELSVIGVYATQAAGDTEKFKREAAARAEGKIVEGDEHAGDADADDWDVTYHVEPWQVQ